MPQSHNMAISQRKNLIVTWFDNHGNNESVGNPTVKISNEINHNSVSMRKPAINFGQYAWNGRNLIRRLSRKQAKRGVGNPTGQKTMIDKK